MRPKRIMSRTRKIRADKMQGLLLVPLILGDGIPPIWRPAKAGTRVLVVGENCETVLDVALRGESPAASSIALENMRRQTY